MAALTVRGCVCCDTVLSAATVYCVLCAVTVCCVLCAQRCVLCAATVCCVLCCAVCDVLCAVTVCRSNRKMAATTVGGGWQCPRGEVSVGVEGVGGVPAPGR